jgi:hypothetical protein
MNSSEILELFFKPVSSFQFSVPSAMMLSSPLAPCP